MPARTLRLEGGLDCEIPHRLETGTSASEDVGPRRGVDFEISHRLERGTKYSLYGCGNLSLVDAF